MKNYWSWVALDMVCEVGAFILAAWIVQSITGNDSTAVGAGVTTLIIVNLIMSNFKPKK